MARYDVFAVGPEDLGFWLDCQSNFLRHLSHRFVVPLLPREAAPLPIARFNPGFVVNGVEVVMMTQFAATVPVAELKRAVASLAHEHHRIIEAIDTLITDN